MNWQPLSDRLYIKADSKVWSMPTDRQLFRFDFAPATAGELEISQGDGMITFGRPIMITTDISPIVINLSLPLLVSASDRRIALKASRTLRMSISVLDVEPIIYTSVTEQLSAISTQIESLALSLSSMNGNSQYSDLCTESTTESTTEFTTLLEANSRRKFASIMNNSNSILYIDYDNEVSAENYAVKILPFGYFEMPIVIQTKVVGLWERVNGSAFIREFT